MARVLIVDESVLARRAAERALARAGMEVQSTSDTREAIDSAQRSVPDVVLVDRSLQDLNQPDFCRAIRNIANLRDTPVVLMGARAEDISDEAVADVGAIDAIGKPFAPEALLAVTTNALRRAPARPQPSAEHTTAEDPHLERLQGARAIAGRIAEVIGPAIERMAGLEAGPPSAARLAQAIEHETDHDILFSLVRELGRLAPGSRGETSFEGRLEHVGLGEVLQLAQHQRMTGILEVERRGRQVQLCLRDGLVDIVLAQGNDTEFLLGRYLLDEGFVEAEDLDMLLRHRAGSKRLLGAQLVKLGYITTDDLQQALRRQSSELIYEALRWGEGTFRFERFARRPEADEARLELPVAEVLMEGLRRVDEWRLIEEQVRSFDQVLEVDAEALAFTDPDGLSSDERRVLAAIDGERTVRDIVERTSMASFDACKILFQLMTSRLVKERPD